MWPSQYLHFYVLGFFVVVTQAKICLELAKEEAKLLQEGDDVSLDSDVLLSILISIGIDLEDQQYVNIFSSSIACVVDKP